MTTLRRRRRRKRRRRKTRRKRGRGKALNSLLKHQGQRRGTHSSKSPGRRASPEALRRLERHKTRRAPRETRSAALREFAGRVPPPNEPPPSPPAPERPRPTGPITAFTDIATGQQMRERGRRAQARREQLVRTGTPTFGEQFKGTGAANIAAQRPLSVSEHYDPRDGDYAFVARTVPAARQGKPSRRKRIVAWWRGKKKKKTRKKKTRDDDRWDKYANSGGRRRRTRRRTRRKRRRRRRSRSKRGGNQEECCISTKCPPKGYSLVKNAPPPPPLPVRPPGPTPESGATKQGTQRAAFLGNIVGFKKGALKKPSKAKSKKKTNKPSKAKSKSFLAQIQAGKELKSAKSRKLKEPEESQKSDLGSVLGRAMDARRQFVDPNNNSNSNSNNNNANWDS